MAVTFTPASDHAKKVHVVGDMMLLIGTLTFSGSYSTGGDSLDLRAILAQTGLGTVDAVIGHARGHGMEYDNTNKKLKLYASANTEHAAAAYNAALTGSAVPVVVIGR